MALRTGIILCPTESPLHERPTEQILRFFIFVCLQLRWIWLNCRVFQILRPRISEIFSFNNPSIYHKHFALRRALPVAASDRQRRSFNLHDIHTLISARISREISALSSCNQICEPPCPNSRGNGSNFAPIWLCGWLLYFAAKLAQIAHQSAEKAGTMIPYLGKTSSHRFRRYSYERVALHLLNRDSIFFT